MNNKRNSGRAVITILGGIGNQLFSYACGYAFSKDHNMQLLLDLSSYENGYFRKYRLDELNIEYERVYRKTVAEKIRKKIGIDNEVSVNELIPYKYQQIGLNYTGKQNIKLTGYWQSERYFVKYREDILNLFRMKDQDKVNQTSSFINTWNSRNIVAVHVRRGDFVEGGCACGLDYYDKAMEIMNREISNPEFIFFTDDRPFVSEHFKIKDHDNYHLFDVDGADDLTELFCMSSCKHQISSNSSFAWWGAWLKRSSDPLIIAPLLPYLENSDYYPEKWTLIRAELEEKRE